MLGFPCELCPYFRCLIKLDYGYRQSNEYCQNFHFFSLEKQSGRFKVWENKEFRSTLFICTQVPTTKADFIFHLSKIGKKDQKKLPIPIYQLYGT